MERYAEPQYNPLKNVELRLKLVDAVVSCPINS
jgi:hypothetical protein